MKIITGLSKSDKAYFGKKSIVIAMPAYNEEKNISRVVIDAFSVLRKITDKYCVLVVNDGSSDGTKKILDNLKKKYSNLKLIHLKKNMGVGYANNLIYHTVEGDILFWNASDNQIHMEEIFRMLPYIKHNDIIVGKRIKRADTFIRRFMSACFSIVLKMRFNLPVKDVDSVKILRISILKKLDIQSKTAFVETEILIRAKNEGLKIIEVPIKHYPRLEGKAKGIRLKIIIPQLRQLFKAVFTRW